MFVHRIVGNRFAAVEDRYRSFDLHCWQVWVLSGFSFHSCRFQVATQLEYSAWLWFSWTHNRRVTMACWAKWRIPGLLFHDYDDLSGRMCPPCIRISHCLEPLERKSEAGQAVENLMIVYKGELFVSGDAFINETRLLVINGAKLPVQRFKVCGVWLSGWESPRLPDRQHRIFRVGR